MKVLCVVTVLATVFGPAVSVSNYYMDLRCGQTVDFNSNFLTSMRLRLTSRSSYMPNMDCTLVLRTSSVSFNDRFMLYFKDINIESSSSCTNDYLEVRDGSSSTASYVSGLYGRQCGLYISNGVRTTTGNYLYLRFKSDNSLQYRGFDMVITKYHTGLCYSNEYDCSNGRCIASYDTCNGYNPCGDHSDCPITLEGGAIAGIVVGSVFFLVVLLVVLIVVRRRRLRYANVSIVSGNPYGTSGGYNQPVQTQYPQQQYPQQQYPTGQQYPPSYQ